jgi:hypothetical protein
MSRLSIAIAVQAGPGLPAHHVPDGLDWLPFLGLVLIVLAMVSAIASRSQPRSDGNGADDD